VGKRKETAQLQVHPVELTKKFNLISTFNVQRNPACERTDKRSFLYVPSLRGRTTVSSHRRWSSGSVYILVFGPGSKMTLFPQDFSVFMDISRTVFLLWAGLWPSFGWPAGKYRPKSRVLSFISGYRHERGRFGL
jgi:hypothetical protein